MTQENTAFRNVMQRLHRVHDPSLGYNNATIKQLNDCILGASSPAEACVANFVKGMIYERMQDNPHITKPTKVEFLEQEFAAKSKAITCLGLKMINPGMNTKPIVERLLKAGAKATTSVDGALEAVTDIEGVIESLVLPSLTDLSAEELSEDEQPSDEEAFESSKSGNSSETGVLPKDVGEPPISSSPHGQTNLQVS